MGFTSAHPEYFQGLFCLALVGKTQPRVRPNRASGKSGCLLIWQKSPRFLENGWPGEACCPLPDPWAPIDVSSARSLFWGPWPSLLCQGDVGQWFVGGEEQEGGGILAVKLPPPSLLQWQHNELAKSTDPEKETGDKFKGAAMVPPVAVVTGTHGSTHTSVAGARGPTCLRLQVHGDARVAWWPQPGSGPQPTGGRGRVVESRRLSDLPLCAGFCLLASTWMLPGLVPLPPS